MLRRSPLRRSSRAQHGRSGRDVESDQVTVQHRYNTRPLYRRSPLRIIGHRGPVACAGLVGPIQKAFGHIAARGVQKPTQRAGKDEGSHESGSGRSREPGEGQDAHGGATGWEHGEQVCRRPTAAQVPRKVRVGEREVPDLPQVRSDEDRRKQPGDVPRDASARHSCNHPFQILPSTSWRSASRYSF
jgi:hypothetical protein